MKPTSTGPTDLQSTQDKIYDLFLSLIDRGGRVLDLGCGNGLVLRHLVENSEFELEPYGLTSSRSTLRQAREVVLPQFADNLSVANVANVNLEPSSFDFMFFDPYDIHPDDILTVVERILSLGADLLNSKWVFGSRSAFS